MSGSPAAWLDRRGFDGRIVRSYGATEVFPPEDADCIVDNTATGATLKANGLMIFDELMRSSTRLYACPRSLEQPGKRARIEHFVVLIRSVLDARKRVMLEVNVPADRLEEVVAILPCMREPTIAPLHHEAGFAVKAAVPRADLPELIRAIKERGGTDIVVFEHRADRAVTDDAAHRPGRAAHRRDRDPRRARPRRRGPGRGRRPASASSTTC